MAGVHLRINIREQVVIMWMVVELASGTKYAKQQYIGETPGKKMCRCEDNKNVIHCHFKATQHKNVKEKDHRNLRKKLQSLTQQSKALQTMQGWF